MTDEVPPSGDTPKPPGFVRRFWKATRSWFLVSLILGGPLPFGILWAFLLFNRGRIPAVASVVGHGEFYLVSAVLTAGQIRHFHKRDDLLSRDSFLALWGFSSFGVFAWIAITAARHPDHLVVSLSWIGGMVFFVLTLIYGSIVEYRVVAKGRS